MKSLGRMLVIALFVTLPLAAQTPPEPSPAELWDGLMTGNKAFMSGKLTYDQLTQQRERQENRQSPQVTIVSCADSRVPPELIFNKSIGDLFIVRVAGNIVDDFAIGSLEYAAPPLHNWSKLIVVLGHSDCGAVGAALRRSQPKEPVSPSLLAVLTRIRESFGGMKYLDPYTDEEPLPKPLRRAATEANALSVVAYIRAHSPALKNSAIYAAYYDMATGEVTRVMPRP